MKFPALFAPVSLCLIAVCGSLPASAAIVTYTMPDTPQFTTVPQAPAQFTNDGIWLMMASG